MRCRIMLAAVALFFASTAAALAQEASVGGTILDESKGVLPGVAVTATGIETGRQFTSVTSEQGVYRLAGLPPGRYRILAELAGFATATIPDVELLVGQNATISIGLQLATLAENVTVSGTAPLVDTTQARVAGNVDRRQMEELPIEGRNWQQLSMMVSAAASTASSATTSSTPGTPSPRRCCRTQTRRLAAPWAAR